MFDVHTISEMEEVGFNHAISFQKPNYPYIEGLYPDLEDAYATAYYFGYYFCTFIFLFKKNR